MKTILIIDSCAVTRECLSAILRAKGYRVQCAGLISQAKAMLAKRVPDILITEIRLPDDNSLNLMRSLKADPRYSTLKMCLLTQAASKKPLMEAIELGVCKVILKPKFTLNGFLEQLASIVDAPSTQSKSTSTPQDPASLRYPTPSPVSDPALGLKDIKPVISRTKLKEGLDEMEDVLTLSEPIMKALEAIENPDSDIDDVADLIKLDTAISLKLMRIANSADYAREENTSTVKDALIRIGLEEVKTLLTSLGVVGKLQENATNKHFWNHSLAVATCCSKIATLCPSTNSEVAFMAGMLHDIGRLVLEQTFPEEYAQVIETANRLGVPLELAEKRMLLIDHASIAQSLLHSWNIPKDIADSIGGHHLEFSKLKAVCNKNLELATILAMSNRIVHSMAAGCSGNKVITTTEEFFASLELEELTLDWVLDGLEDEILSSQKSVLGSEQSDSSLLDSSHAAMPVFDHPFFPLYVTMDDDSDAIGHWVTMNADEQEEGAPPNIIILHARQPKDKEVIIERLEEKLAKIQFDSTQAPIPMLILSPSGKTAIAEKPLSERPCKILMTPFSVSLLEDAINELLNGAVKPIEQRSARQAA